MHRGRNKLKTGVAAASTTVAAEEKRILCRLLDKITLERAE
jgi:hypothetical protein